MLAENTTGRNTHTEVRVEATTDMPTCFVPVSYTHLDVYKRQPLHLSHTIRPVANW